MMLKNRWTALACGIILGLTGALSPIAVNTAYASYKKTDGVYRMIDGTAIDGVVARGIDVSHWKGDIDWKAVADDDVQFVMLGTTYSGGVDPKFEANAKGASDAGLEVGAYLYSYAATPEMASAEADFILDLIKDYPISYPIAFDAESSALGALSPQEISLIINTFCKKIEDAGYYPMVYANDYWLANKIDLSLMNYDVWVARYELKHSFENPVMWQATQTGSVAGVQGNVDIDFQYKDLSAGLPANLWRTIGDNTYYYQNHVMQKNTWIDDGTGWFYIGPDARTEKGWKQLDGHYYYLNEDSGRMTTGWLTQNNQTYYMNTSGAMSTGWVDVDGARYFMNHNGVMQTGWITDETFEYYLNTSTGKMESGWQSLNSQWYYLNEHGQKMTGAVTLDGVLYYLDSSTGVMAANTVITIDGIDYNVDGSGACTQVVVEETPTEEGEIMVEPDSDGVSLRGPGEYQN